MTRRLLYGAGAVLGLLGLRYYLMASAPDLTPPPSIADAAASNPLPACPSTRNCVRTTRTYPVSPARLFEATQATLQKTGATSSEATPGAYRIDAVYQIFVFSDDVAVAILPHGEGVALHIRSASRIGRGDWSVNARRVAKILKTLETEIEAAA